MAIHKSEKQELLDKLNELLKKQSLFQQEINELEKRIVNLSTSPIQPAVKHEKTESVYTANPIKRKKEPEKVHLLSIPDKSRQPKQPFEEKLKNISPDLEKFIGENLINKIGIAVLIIGVGIGAKYAIDNDLISTLVRIILGYLVGFILNYFAFRLKKNYYNFSAVLASGAMAIHFFITYAAYTYYNLIPNIAAFILMVAITVLTVALALNYNRQVIAHFGLAGAYIIPFLLKDPESSVLVLLIYMTIINCGILYISTKKQWKPLNYIALISTWVIFMSWFSSQNYNNELGLSLTFSTIFFALFYLVFLSYKLILKEKFRIDDILFLMLNSGMFYLIGIIALETSNLSKEYAGLFTLTNAALHGFTSLLIYKTEQKDRKLFYWTIGLVITFFTITIPIQFNNAVIVIVWSAEAAALFWYSRKVQKKFYETISLMVVLGIFIVSLSNWSSASYFFYGNEIETKMIKPLFNPEFLASVCAAVSLLFIFLLNRKKTTDKSGLPRTDPTKILISTVLLLLLYFTFFSQISLYWNNVQVQSSFELNNDNVWIKQNDHLNSDIFNMKSIWLINYTIVFLATFAVTNFKWLKDPGFNRFLLISHYVFILIFLTVSLDHLTQLRESYLNPSVNPNFDVTILHILVRYIAYFFFALLLFSLHHYINPGVKLESVNEIFDVTFSVSLVWVFSSELINWLSLFGSNELYKYWLSILWGVFSLLLIGYGIWKKKKHLRITAIALFGITLLKLFLYDLTNLQTVPKTIVFVLIGALLLTVSYLYNKYKYIISEENRKIQ